MARALTAHITEIGKDVSKEKADESEDGGTCSNTVSIWSNAHGESDASEPRQHIQKDHPSKSNTKLDTCSHIYLSTEVAENVLEMTVEEGWSKESP